MLVQVFLSASGKHYPAVQKNFAASILAGRWLIVKSREQGSKNIF
jgi:hypothetical protein